jgi:hypothetical protein
VTGALASPYDGRADLARGLIVEDVPIIDPCLRLTPVGSMVVVDLTVRRQAGPHIWPLAPIRPYVLLSERDRRRVLATLMA